MIKFVFELFVGYLKGEIVEISRSNEEQINGNALSHYDFILKTKTPTYKKAGAKILESR